jgi:hypothetical protein
MGMTGLDVHTIWYFESASSDQYDRTSTDQRGAFRYEMPSAIERPQRWLLELAYAPDHGPRRAAAVDLRVEAIGKRTADLLGVDCDRDDVLGRGIAERVTLAGERPELPPGITAMLSLRPDPSRAGLVADHAAPLGGAPRRRARALSLEDPARGEHHDGARHRGGRGRRRARDRGARRVRAAGGRDPHERERVERGARAPRTSAVTRPFRGVHERRSMLG